MLAYQAADGCRMEFLRRELDDPEAAACGRCDNCTGRPWSADVAASGVAAAEDRLGRPGVSVEPRKMWPTGMKELGIDGASGKIAASRTAEPGRALGRLTDVGWGSALARAVRGRDAGRAGHLAAHRRGGQGARGVGLVFAPGFCGDAAFPDAAGARGEPRPADRRHRAAFLPRVARLRHARRPRSPAAQQRAAPGLAVARARRYPTRSARRFRAAAADGPVLLVDDQIDSGWTMTVAAALLRDAGAPAVLPLALAVTAG